MNIIEEVEKITGQAPVQKIDPNTQAPKEEISQDSFERLSQAAIPVALTGLYKYTNNGDQAANLFGGNYSTKSGWVEEIFQDKADVIVSHIADYATVGITRAKSALEEAIEAGKTVALNAVGSNAKPADITKFFTAQRSEILKRLPAALQLGDLINDNTLDDRTNKMEGPVSGFLHKIEKLFSDSDANDSSKQ